MGLFQQPPDSNRLFAIDACLILVVSAAISVASRQLAFMTVFVPAVILARMAAVAAVARSEGVSLGAEACFLLLCTALGAFNDWNSVCNKKIYDYTVPHYFAFSTIPIWMLLYWGMILRFLARMARWQVLGPPADANNAVGLGRFVVESAPLKVAAELALVLVTRQAIYRLYEHPVLSWLPFLLALLVMLVLFRPDRHDLKLLAIFLVGGPLIEILYIQLGDLHRYHHGWIGGVPLWIALWWLVCVLIWKDLAFRVESALRRRFPLPLEGERAG